MRTENGYNYLIEVDGGINTKTILPCAKAGLDVAVAGSSIFCKPDYAAAIKELTEELMKIQREINSFGGRK